MAEPDVLELTREEILDRLERGAQRRLQLAAREFIQAYRGGQLPEPGAVADLVALIFLLPENDPLFDGARA